MTIKIERILDYIKSWLYYPKIEESLRQIKMTRHQYAKGHYDMVKLFRPMRTETIKAYFVDDINAPQKSTDLYSFFNDNSKIIEKARSRNKSTEVIGGITINKDDLNEFFRRFGN